MDSHKLFLETSILDQMGLELKLNSVITMIWYPSKDGTMKMLSQVILSALGARKKTALYSSETAVVRQAQQSFTSWLEMLELKTREEPLMRDSHLKVNHFSRQTISV